MKEFLIGSLIGSSIGLIVGSVMVARNKKLSKKITEGIDSIEQKMRDAKQKLNKKLDECRFCEESQSQKLDQNCQNNVCC